MVDFRLNIEEAVNAPRFHYQWMPNKTYVEKSFSPEVMAELKKREREVGTMATVATAGASRLI